MVLDTLENASKYFSLHPSFAKAFEYLSKTDFLNTADGSFVVSDTVKGGLSTIKGKTAEESLKTFECHNKNIDIQFCVKGIEIFGWKSRQKCLSPKGQFNDEKDVLFFDDTPDTYFSLNAGQFVILFPDDVHAPVIGNGEIKKVVLKVKK